MAARQHIDDDQRRARLVARHHLGRTATTVDDAVRALVAVHSSDPITPPLALWSRVTGLSLNDVDDALYHRRSLWRLHAMRRTLFVTHVRDAPMLLAACSRDVAATERRKLEQWVAAARTEPDPDEVRAHIAALEEATRAALADGVPRRTQDLRDLVEGLGQTLTVGGGGKVPLASKVPFLLALDAQLVRAQSMGSWISSQYRWADRSTWFGGAITDDDLDLDPDASRADLVRAYLQAHGPATATDVAWWTGWGKRVTAAAVASSAAVEVDFDDGAVGLVLPHDVGSAPAIRAPSVCLLPGLDPTVMGWKERRWYLGDRADRLFDTNGNAGPMIMVDGRVVGGWAVRAGEVVTGVLDDVGGDVRSAIELEAAALTAWLDGVSPTPRFRTPLERELSASSGG